MDTDNLIQYYNKKIRVLCDFGFERPYIYRGLCTRITADSILIDDCKDGIIALSSDKILSVQLEAQ